MIEKGMKLHLHVTGTAAFSKFSVPAELCGSLSLPPGSPTQSSVSIYWHSLYLLHRKDNFLIKCNHWMLSGAELLSEAIQASRISVHDLFSPPEIHKNTVI